MNALAISPEAEAAAFQTLVPRASNHAAISFTIAAPLAKVYARWLQYQGFPHFMRGREEGEEENGRITWRIRMDDVESPWEAEVSEEVPQQRIAWKNVFGRPSRNSGSVTFRAVGENRTQVTIAIEFELSGGGEAGADPLAPLATRLERNLVNFAEFAKELVQ
jgi:uncharacterized membrane protein